MIEAQQLNPADLARMMRPSMHDAYSHLSLSERPITITLTPEQQQAILWAYDYGVGETPTEIRAILDGVMGHLKEEIHP